MLVKRGLTVVMYFTNNLSPKKTSPYLNYIEFTLVVSSLA